AVLVYLEPARRRDFARAVERTGASWLSCERPGVVELEGSGEPLDDEASFELGLDGRRIAACDPHGRWLRWAPEQPASGE
ncbi:MAG: hypothetical protein H0W09_03285, partial [Solirubrobacterales bacterium]|nr:hypothetical protein [Solirubrobacterales bacterium]